MGFSRFAPQRVISRGVAQVSGLPVTRVRATEAAPGSRIQTGKPDKVEKKVSAAVNSFDESGELFADIKGKYDIPEFIKSSFNKIAKDYSANKYSLIDLNTLRFIWHYVPDSDEKTAICNFYAEKIDSL